MKGKWKRISIHWKHHWNAKLSLLLWKCHLYFNSWSMRNSSMILMQAPLNSYRWRYLKALKISHSKGLDLRNTSNTIWAKNASNRRYQLQCHHNHQRIWKLLKWEAKYCHCWISSDQTICIAIQHLSALAKSTFWLLRSQISLKRKASYHFCSEHPGMDGSQLISTSCVMGRVRL